jgi:hypothetical protein
MARFVAVVFDAEFAVDMFDHAHLRSMSHIESCVQGGRPLVDERSGG